MFNYSYESFLLICYYLFPYCYVTCHGTRRLFYCVIFVLSSGPIVLHSYISLYDKVHFNKIIDLSMKRSNAK